MMVVGGMRPPVPISVGAGSEFPVDVSTIEDEPISVFVRLVPVPNSATVPLTETALPIATVGADDVKTNMPSEVASSASGRGSCIKKPLVLNAVTTPTTSATGPPTTGDVWLAP